MIYTTQKRRSHETGPGGVGQAGSRPLASLEDLSEAEIELLWAVEALRRDDEIKAGKVSVRPADKVLKDDQVTTSMEPLEVLLKDRIHRTGGMK